MQNQSDHQTIVDPITKLTYSIRSHAIEVIHQDHKILHSLSNISDNYQKKSYRDYLKFVQKNSPYLNILPHGTTAICKSQRIQQINLNKTIQNGCLWWELFVPHTTLFLTVGVKDNKKDKVQTFDFCLKNSAKLYFKIDLESRVFKSWINGVASSSKPTIKLQDGCSWTPFVRIRDVGSTISINSFINDPQNKISSYNPFYQNSGKQLNFERQDDIMEQKDIQISNDTEFNKIQLISNENLMLRNEKQIKILKRNKESKQFQFDDAIVKEKNVEGTEKLWLLLSSAQYSLLKSAEIKWDLPILTKLIKHKGKIYMQMTKNQWVDWLYFICCLLDKKLLKSDESKEFTLGIYEIILQKIQILRYNLQLNLKINRLTNLDTNLIALIDKNSFNLHQQSHLRILSDCYYNNQPSIKFPQDIISLGYSNNYIIPFFEANKISIYSIRGIVVKIGDFIMSKAIKKENQLSQYQREGQDIKDNDFSKPSIYKILKNCLKYADKVKPPEKLLKELQQKKKEMKKKQKKAQIKLPINVNEIIPDKTLENTLISMGFDIKISRQALIQCKNSSLQSAIDLIIKGQIKIIEQQVKIPARKSDWTCPQCTLVNDKKLNICLACDAPAPVFEQNYQSIDQPQNNNLNELQEEVCSKKLEEKLETVYPFQTNIGMIPLIVGGVFKSVIRFRLFCINPKFYSYFYQKQDSYVNLLNNNLIENVNQLKTDQLQAFYFTYFSSQELKQKNFGWIPVEDYDVLKIHQNVLDIKYESVDLTKQFFIFKIKIVYENMSVDLSLRIDTSKVFLQKQKSIKLQSEQINEKMDNQKKDILSLQSEFSYRYTNEVKQSNCQIYFNAYLAHQTTQSRLIDVKPIYIDAIDNKVHRQIPLNIIKCDQALEYPNVSLLSMAKTNHSELDYHKKIVLGSFQQQTISFDYVSLQIKKSVEEARGYFYFSNDYSKQTCYIYPFKFEKDRKIIRMNLPNVKAKFLIVALQPAIEENVIQLIKITAYGSIVQKSLPSSLIIAQNLQKNVKIELIGIKDGHQENIQQFSLKSTINNSPYDLSLLNNQDINQNWSFDLNFSIAINAQISKKYNSITLKNILLEKYRLVKVDSSVVKREEKTIDPKDEFNAALDQFIINGAQECLDKIISEQFLPFKHLIKNKDLTNLITKIIAETPFLYPNRKYLQIFIKLFTKQLKNYRQELKLKNILIQAMNNERLTTFGLQLLLLINQGSEVLGSQQLIEIIQRSLSNIDKWKSQNNNKIYSIYDSDIIFSPYLHKISNNNEALMQLTKKLDESINCQMILNKHKFVRRYRVDLKNVYALNMLNLAFEKSKNLNKAIISLNWIDNQSKEHQISDFIDQLQWSQLVLGNNKNSLLTVPLDKYQIICRYVTLSIHFTLHPFIGSKPEIQNVGNNQILPFFYGKYISKGQKIDKKYPIQRNLKHIGTIFGMNKSIVENKLGVFVYKREEMIADQPGDIQFYLNRIQSKDNKDKLVKLLMCKPSKQCINFDYTILCLAIELLMKQSNIRVSNEFIGKLINLIVKNQSGIIQQFGIKLIKHLINIQPELIKQILLHDLQSQNRVNRLFNPLNNPLKNVQIKRYILNQLQSTENRASVLNNCLNIIKSLTPSDKDDSLVQISSELITIYNESNRLQEVCVIIQKLGWNGQANIDLSNQSDYSLIQRILKTATNNQILLKQLTSKSQNYDNTTLQWLIFEELSSRGLNQQESDSLYLYFIGQLQDQNNLISPIQILQKLIKKSNHFSLGDSVAIQFLHVYFESESRQILLSEFLNINLLSRSNIIQEIIKMAIEQLNELKQTKKSKQNRDFEEEFYFLAGILSFTIADLKNLKLNESTKKGILSILAQFLETNLNFGGFNNCNYLKQVHNSKITISYCLITIYLSNSLNNIEQIDLSKLIKWYIVNLSHNKKLSIPQSNHHKLKDTHRHVWTIFTAQIQKSTNIFYIISKVIDNILESAKTLKKNRLLKIIYESKVYIFIKKFLTFVDKHQKNQILMPVLLNNNLFFRKILAQIKCMEVFETQDNKPLSQKQLINQLTLVSTKSAPKDWVMYKHGAKNNVKSISFKNDKDIYTLTFQSASKIWVSQILIGFQGGFIANSNPISNNPALIPKEITVQIGNQLQHLQFIGRLQATPMQQYMAHSISTFSLNLNWPLNKNWHLIKNNQCKFIRFSIKSPYAKFISEIHNKSYISFLSITGYQQQNNSPISNDASSLIQCIDLISLPKFKDYLRAALQNNDTQAQFKTTLLSLSNLMGNEAYGLIIHKFLMRICQINDEIGNKMLDQYLQLKNPGLFSKISAEIVLSNLSLSGKRLSKYYSFINDQLQAYNYKKSVEQKAQIIPFINKFIQIISIIKNTQNLYQDKSISHEFILNQQILSIIIQNAKNNQTFRKFSVLILSSETYFTFTGFKLNEILLKLYSSQNRVHLQILATVIFNQNKCNQWFKNGGYLKEIFNYIFNRIEQDKELTKVIDKLVFLTIICQNIKLKQLITRQQYDLRIFEILVGKKGQKILTQSQNKDLRSKLVEFIVRASLNSPNQKIVGAMLKDSLSSLILEGSQQFIAEIFLPLLNSYNKTIVTLIPYSKIEKKVVGDLSSLQNQTSVNKIKIQPKITKNYKLHSLILNEEERKIFYNKLSEISGIKWGCFQLITNHGKFLPNNSLQLIKKNLFSGKKSILILIKAKKKFGLFYNSNKKSLPLDNTSLPSTKGSFCFEIDENSKDIKVIQNKTLMKESILAIQKVYKGLTQQDIQVEQMLTLMGDGKVLAQINLDGLNGSFLYQSNMASGSNIINNAQIIQSVQYWIFDSESINSYETIFASGSNFASKLANQLDSYSFFNQTLKTNQSFSLVRYETTYQFPSSITIQQLKQSIQILGSQLNDQSLDKLQIQGFGFNKLNKTMTLEQIVKSNKSETLILDLYVQLENIPNFTQKNNLLRKIQFLPKKGILKFFEENDGIKNMIKVIKKSISQWKNNARRQKWLQYATQLQNFATFPNFFSAFLKDKDTFKLLLQLLSGLPDKQTDIKWDQLQKSSSQKLLKIVSDMINLDHLNQFRNYAMKNDFMITILQRLRLITGIFKRHYEQQVVEQQTNISPSKQPQPDDGTKKVKKKKGVGYGNDANQNTKWTKSQNMEHIKKEFQSIQNILSLIQNFFNTSNWKIPNNLYKQIMQSCLLPYIEDCLRAGTLLQISKHPQKSRSVMKLIRAICRQQKLLNCLLPLSNNYQPSQTESIESLLRSLFNISKIFISCLSQNLSKQDKLSQQLAEDIITTYNLVEQALQQRQIVEVQDKQFTDILKLPMDKQYKELLKDLRFDYIDMKQSPNKIKHHYSSYFTSNYTPNHNKMIRLAQELADISTALPYQHTNGIYVRCDKDRVDFMQAMIMGANGTPYGHGAFLFDIYFDDNYPNGPPKVNLTTTGHGKIRFNPNLYACGKVCLSLLGTWRGRAYQNWDPKISTLLQVLLSIQSIIMSQEVYFNQPGFEGEQGTQQGEKKNQAYSNIVRYGNIKFAMTENIRHPPKGFEAVIRRHFYLKKNEIMQQCRKWQKYAEKRLANYVGLTNDHNVSWSAQFKKSKTQYKDMLDIAVKELQIQLNKLQAPKITDITAKVSQKAKKNKDGSKNKKSELLGQKLEQIDVSYDSNKVQSKQLDINDEKVKDRWSRYIGAMGIDAVSKQSKADILLLGLGPFGLEVTKNLVLSGCRKLTLCDDRLVSNEDLSGGFFYQQADIGKKRLQAISHKIKELNAYVKIDSIKREELTSNILATYAIVFVSQLPFPQQKALSILCRQKNVKFISADCRGAYCRLVNDFGSFTVLDKNGQEPVEVMLGQIQTSQNGVVTVLQGSKHPFEDGEAIFINNVQGMNSLQQQGKSINGTIHKIKVINYKSFQLGNTLKYDKYIRNGTAKNIKTPLEIKFNPFQTSIDPNEEKLSIDTNVQFYDFSKHANQKIVQRCFIILDRFINTQKRFPESWNSKDAKIFYDMYCALWKQVLSAKEEEFIYKFSFVAKGYLPPLCAFFGGLAAQQVIKGITQKFKPLQSSIYLQFSEVTPKKEKQGEWTQQQLIKIYKKSNSRDNGFAIVVGNQLIQQIKQAKLFMIGAGAIGCQLLKNFAMINLGVGKSGKIILTDPDHIQNSNLNRQFLFRQKHISKPKSSTAAASILSMNPLLKDHVSALLQRVSDSTKDIFSNKFFESLTIVANALDNVAARRYVDQRCVQNKIPLFESGTLGPKGHVQVIIPYLTQSYGSQNDPVQQGQIPHCTLKMFPQQTLHCIQWARDIFGKKFSLQTKALSKFLQKSYKPEPDDIKSLNESLTMIVKAPKNFQDCIYYATTKFYKYYRDDIIQLLYTYPLDAKTKNGQPFWRLPKRPPTPIKQFDPENSLHCTFVTSFAVLIAKMYKIPHPQNFRTQIERAAIGKVASKIKIADYVPSDEKAKAILKETTAQQKKKQQKSAQQPQNLEQIEKQKISLKDELQIHKEIIENAGQDFQIKIEQFEKDDDANGHIDFIYSMANLRAINYKLDQMDWITTKLKAGRIVPALSTTTSCVAGLQVLEMCKYLKKVKIDDMKNSYLNLAIPSLQMSEPGEVKKKKINDKLSVSIWDRWEVPCTDKSTFGDVFAHILQKYGLYSKGVLQGMSRIDTSKSEEQKKQFLKSLIIDKLQKEENYIDIVVLCTVLQSDDKIMQGIPTIRLIFDK